MTNDRWADVVGHIKDTFTVLEEERQDLEENPGFCEWIVFQSPAGKMKLERTTRPLVLGKKAIGSRRIGSTTHVEYEYSPTEETHSVKAYRWNDQDSSWSLIENTPMMYQG